MTSLPDRAELAGRRTVPSPAEELSRQVWDVLRHAVDAHRKGLKVYESLRRLNEVVGTEYGDRVLYELIQNAHDAHRDDNRGRIAVRLVVRSETDGTLYVANGGTGFRRKDVEAIENLATTAKKIGEGIGNKGLGFRSVEALTDDVRIFSRVGISESAHFDGYCFRFAAVGEIENLLLAEGLNPTTAREVAHTIPRYLVPQPLSEQPEEVVAYARLGYATVIVVPLSTTEAIALAKRQAQALADLEVPLLLFLDRIGDFRIDVETPDGSPYRRRLSRSQRPLGDVPDIPRCRMYEVGVGQDRRFLVVQREVDKALVLEAVEQSVSGAPQLKRWLDWKGQPTVSVAVGMSRGAVVEGRLYNFLPMGDAASAPLLGHLDAPFFAGIDRRRADFDLPLNALLLKAAAEASAQAALHIAGRAATPILQRAVFDLVAWTGPHAGKLDAALNRLGSSLKEAPVVPVIPVERDHWASLSGVNVWPAGSFSLMKAAEVAKRTGAKVVSPALDDVRRERLVAMAQRIHRSLRPSNPRLAEWSELFARSLADRNAKPRTWSRFYNDLKSVFSAASADLGALAGKVIMLDRSKKLRAAGVGGASGRGVFVPSEAGRRKRTKDGVPLPPATLARRYRFVDERIRFRRDTLNAFLEADLAREYDPVEALSGLASALGARANDNRRREALTWAFRVYGATGDGLQEVLQSAGLWVPTLSGWQPATQATFSSSWTPVGRTAENYLVEASGASPDCRRARDGLLVDFSEWPSVPGGSKGRWIDFLMLLGVSHGLKPVAGHLPTSAAGATWNQLMRTGDSKEGLDAEWCSETSRSRLGHRNTVYRRRGEAWRLPGQVEHEELPGGAKEAFHELAFKHLEQHNTEFLSFEIGRFERARRSWDQRRLPTPLATFLRSRAWIDAGTHEEPGFLGPSECWAARTRQRRPPRFVHRVPDAVAGLVENSKELANLVFGAALGLRDWHGPETAAERLQVLAAVAPALATHDRLVFRREYRRAWLEVADAGAVLPAGLGLAVSRDGRLEMLNGDATKPTTVILAQSAQRFEARVLDSAGYPWLDIGDAPAEKVAEQLEATGRFVPRRLGGTDVQLLVDGERFVPSTNDPLLTSIGLEWLPEIVLLGHELLAEQLERGVQPATVDRRVRAIRVRHCQTITLVVDEQDTSPRDSLDWYGFDHEALPTLILSDRVPLTWTTLGKDLARTVSRLVDRRFRFLEALLPQLALGQRNGTLNAPSDEALAKALRCDAQTLLEHRDALHTDVGRVLHLLTPVVAYFGGVALAQELQTDAEGAGPGLELRSWLRARFPGQLAAKSWLDTCERSSDRAEVRKSLELDYERFNRALLALGEPPLSNEAELRSLYAAYLRQMAARILERLRRHHAADFREGRDLGVYVERKTLTFLAFDTAWIQTKETLEQGIVETHVTGLLSEVLGEDRDVELPSLRGLLETNRKSVRNFASRASAVVLVWCRRNGVPVREPWLSAEPQSVVRQLENAGLLDFEPVDDAQLPGFCRRAACWPDAMPQTLDPATLGLDQTAVEEEERRRETKRQGRIVEERSIDFAGNRLDTGDPSFAQAFGRLAEDRIDGNDEWFERSRRPRLAKFAEPRGGSRSPIDGTRRVAGRRKRPPEELRRAMGLASEWLAFRYLRRHHGEAVDETCWISTNRTRFFGGDEGDDAAGYDFCVNTPQAEWLYEVKSSLENTGEFELTPNEMRVAARTPRRGRRRYRILYVPFVFCPDRWMILELPNPMGDGTRNRFRQIGQGSVRFRFQHPTIEGGS